MQRYNKTNFLFANEFHSGWGIITEICFGSNKNDWNTLSKLFNLGNPLIMEEQVLYQQTGKEMSNLMLNIVEGCRI